MKATYNVTGDERKALVRIISEVIGMKPVYMRMPTCAYVIAGITVEKDGAVDWDERNVGGQADLGRQSYCTTCC